MKMTDANSDLATFPEARKVEMFGPALPALDKSDVPTCGNPWGQLACNRTGTLFSTAHSNTYLWVTSKWVILEVWRG
jgi:hypothetical protein